jgi:enoyl-CoA hydratase
MSSTAAASPVNVSVDAEGGAPVVVVSMDAPRGNALSPSTIKAMSLALYRAEQALGDIDEPKACAVVLKGKATVFSGGLDLKAGAELDRKGVADWVDDFEALFLQLFSLRSPVIAALQGPAIAGGAVLALACDERVVAAEGAFEIGLNEVALGLSFPSAALEIARFALPSTLHTDALVRGRRFGRDEAKAKGVVDEVAADAVAAALARARSFAPLGARAVSKTKLDLRHDALTRARARAIESRRIFVEAWHDPHNVARRQAILDGLKR